MEKVKVLHIVGTMQMGGQETFVMNIFRNIDRNKYEFGFVVHSNKKGDYEEEIEHLGGKIYRITPISKNPIKHMLQLRNVIKENNYKIMHRHANLAIVFVDLLVGRMCKMKKVIIHSHSNTSVKFKVIHKILRPLLNLFATDKLACSQKAGEWLYGKTKFEIIPNSIDIEKFRYSIERRKKIREKENAERKIVIGHVGRFDRIKNHKYLIEIFENLTKKVDNIELWLIGNGEEKENIKKLSKEKGIINNIKFFGTINNTYDYYQGMDFFIFPSIKEGLGIALIEAQVSGLKCIISDTIPKEAIVLNNVKALSINEDAIVWANCVENEIKKIGTYSRDIDTELFEKYKIENLVKRMKEIYN